MILDNRHVFLFIVIAILLSVTAIATMYAGSVGPLTNATS